MLQNPRPETRAQTGLAGSASSAGSAEATRASRSATAATATGAGCSPAVCTKLGRRSGPAGRSRATRLTMRFVRTQCLQVGRSAIEQGHGAHGRGGDRRAAGNDCAGLIRVSSCSRARPEHDDTGGHQTCSRKGLKIGSLTMWVGGAPVNVQHCTTTEEARSGRPLCRSVGKPLDRLHIEPSDCITLNMNTGSTLTVAIEMPGEYAEEWECMSGMLRNA